MQCQSPQGIFPGGISWGDGHESHSERQNVRQVKVDNKEKREQMLKEIRGLVLAGH